MFSHTLFKKFIFFLPFLITSFHFSYKIFKLFLEFFKNGGVDWRFVLILVGEVGDRKVPVGHHGGVGGDVSSVV